MDEKDVVETGPKSLGLGNELDDKVLGGRPVWGLGDEVQGA